MRYQALVAPSWAGICKKPNGIDTHGSNITASSNRRNNGSNRNTSNSGSSSATCNAMVVFVIMVVLVVVVMILVSAIIVIVAIIVYSFFVVNRSGVSAWLHGAPLFLQLRPRRKRCPWIFMRKLQH